MIGELLSICVALVLSYIVALLSMCRRRTLCPLLYDTLGNDGDMSSSLGRFLFAIIVY